MSCNRKQLQIFGWSREVDNFWLKERISWKEIATVRLTMVELVEVSSGSSNGESFVLGICVRDGSVEWWRSAAELRFIIPGCVRTIVQPLQGTQALHRPTQRILTDLSPDFLKTQIPLRSARWAVSTVKTVQIWSSVVRLGRFPTNLVMSKTRWYFNSEWEVGENPLSGPVESLCPLSFYTPLQGH